MSTVHLLENLQEQALSDDLERRGKGGSAQVGQLGARLFPIAAQPEDDVTVGLSPSGQATTILVAVVYVAICAFLGYVEQLIQVTRSFTYGECSVEIGEQLGTAGIVLIWGGGFAVGIYCCVLSFMVRRKGGRFSRRHLLLLLPVLAQLVAMVVLLVLSFSRFGCDT